MKEKLLPKDEVFMKLFSEDILIEEKLFKGK